ncbi:hypothetical protein GCM10025768_04460 [Microbacterium pseudoresistens]|uniref:Endonuclease/exonuclease/phosphatase family metal-dependent hydrolase n=1 Tax=Microbacterium pseudoresistens TaxID=640634 RepID=A0A7Y9EUM4_9MICO|nr:endonuclease/exonuclease/phosphatase family protein [Microbacterium pseudoresistens]NYD54282.1 endonuclease/exonuclease/phosphatase family metal-dependent hydrolase [Microbacterium pseudoresistens]
MRRVSLSALGVVAAWLLIDFWRLWTPSLITLFGRAAETPPEIMGLFALIVMALPLVIVAFLRGPSVRIATGLLVAAFVVRILLRMNPSGGDVQLYGSSIGVVLTVAAVCLAAGALDRAFVPSILLGVAVSVGSHAFLGGFGAVWRSDGWDVALLLVQAVFVGVAVRRAVHGIDLPIGRSPISVRTGVLLLPVLLLTLLALSNVGRGSVVETLWGPVAVVLGSGAAAVVALLPAPRARPWASAVLFPAAVALSLLPQVMRDGADGALPLWALPAFLVGPAAGARLLLYAGPGRSPRRTALATGIGAVVWTALFFAFYAGYDLGYRADAVLVIAAVAISAWVLSYRAGSHDPDFGEASAVRMDDSGARAAAAASIGTVVAAALALVGPAVTIPPVTGAEASGASDSELTVAAYNVRMGYGIDGRFDPIAVAEQIRSSGARVVLLSEVDRGWLLNGGQDQLAILARMLGMQAVFGPAGDQVWGDAILTDLPVSDVATLRMPMFDAVTGAGMTAATVHWNGHDVRVISTHLQPDSSGVDRTQRQAEIFAQALRDAGADGPGEYDAVVGGGDLNTEVDTAAWKTLIGSGAQDALARIRPALTSSADDPQKEIDHLFVSGLRVVDAAVVPSQLSDHFMITTTLR